MVLELHVWGPAFGLPSLDPECLAAVAYLSISLDKTQWKLFQTSPSAVPTRSLPALYSPATSAWTAGFPAIASQLCSDRPPTFRDPDRGLSRSSRAEAVAYSALLRRAAGPLLALSLYVSPANWAAATRPAYSAVLPPPLGWTEAPGARAAWTASAEHLGLDPDGAGSGDAQESRGGNSRTDADGWLRVPGGGASAAAKREAASAEARRVRRELYELAGEALDVLDGLRGDKRWFLEGGTDHDGDRDSPRPTSLDCLALGYLALMLVPGLPRPWLRDVMRRRHDGLCSFVDEMRATCFGAGAQGQSLLPWSAAEDRADGPAPGVLVRLADGVIRNILPGLGGAWPSSSPSPATERDDRGDGTAGDLLAAAGGLVFAAAVAAGFTYRKTIFPLGAPIQRWERSQAGLRNFGAAGAMFGIGDPGV